MNILSTTTTVEAPIIVVKIGDVSFGLYGKQQGQVELFGKYYSSTLVTYPNYIKSLVVEKVNGALNTYTLTLQYAVTERDDPNMIDKILSKVSKSREITFTYGDATTPSFLYREENAIITQVRTSPDITKSSITYTISAVSKALVCQSGKFNFPKYVNKPPSEIIYQTLYDNQYGLLDIFYGMSRRSAVQQAGIIAADDSPTTIEAQTNISALDYIKYLVSCMSSRSDVTDSLQKNIKYTFMVHDEVSELLSGPYFSVDKVVTSAPELTSVDIYQIDVGYPTKDFVYQFSIKDDQSYAILYDYANDIKLNNFTYRIGDDGKVQQSYSPTVSTSTNLLRTTAADKTWWSQMTQFPISATLTIKGLLRSIILMTYLRVNVYFYGKKHNTSGLYIVTKQTDNISESGYSTTLSLVRIQGVEYEV